MNYQHQYQSYAFQNYPQSSELVIIRTSCRYQINKNIQFQYLIKYAYFVIYSHISFHHSFPLFYLFNGNIIKFIFLTMNQNFKIRKNTSLKDIKQQQTTKNPSKDIGSMPSKYSREQTKKNMLKLIHLEPLKSDASSQQIFKKSQLKFDFTQPVNIKANSLSRHDGRYQNAHLAPLEGKQEMKQKSLDKQNRPASMNQLNYFNMAKMKLTLENTLKNESSKLFIATNPKRQGVLQEIKLNQIISKSSQSKIIKSHSRARLLKLGQKDKKKMTEGEEKNEHEGKGYGTFRKGIIDQIFQKNKNNVQKPYQTINIKDKYYSNDLNSLQDSQSRQLIDTYHNSPINKKSEPIFEANCSTINERQENASSFISKKAVEEFIQPLQQLATEVSQDRLLCQKKRKFQIDKIRKKFPENFFK